MTNDLAVSMAELEGESAELLPSRETLNVCHHRASGGSTSFTYQQIGSNQNGLINVALINGNVNVLGANGIFG